MLTSHFDYIYPKELVAQYPLPNRDESNFLIIDKKKEEFEFTIFKNIHNYLEKGDLIVVNNTKVNKARLFAKKDNGTKIELLVLKILSQDGRLPIQARCLGQTSRHIKYGTRLNFKDGVYAIVNKIENNGYFVAEFYNIENMAKWLFANGEIPIPPYLNREYSPSIDDKSYQTIFAKKDGAVASPTAALHFTKNVISNLINKGVNIAEVTLHVGTGSFLPVREENIENHKMMKEQFFVSEESANLINRTKKDGKKVIAVGTTAVRSLESSSVARNIINPKSEETDLFIYPGYEFKIIDGLVTNFHQPKSTLLMLVSAWTGHDLLMRAYSKAFLRKFRLFSYGDSMMII